MDNFWKTAAAVLLAVILCVAVGKRERDISVLLTMFVSCLAAGAAVIYLTPVLDFLRELGEIGMLQEGMLEILMKTVGIALITELITLICVDAGFSSLGKSLQFLGSAAILYLSLPLMENLLTFIQEILGEI